MDRCSVASTGNLEVRGASYGTGRNRALAARDDAGVGGRVGGRRALLAAVLLAAMTQLGSVPTIAGLTAGVLGLAAGIVGIRRGGLMGTLLAVTSVGLAVAAFALLGVAPDRVDAYGPHP
jgi:hypothetical protein